MKPNSYTRFKRAYVMMQELRDNFDTTNGTLLNQEELRQLNDVELIALKYSLLSMLEYLDALGIYGERDLEPIEEELREREIDKLNPSMGAIELC